MLIFNYLRRKKNRKNPVYGGCSLMRTVSGLEIQGSKNKIPERVRTTLS
jgi:hypothetical protein